MSVPNWKPIETAPKDGQTVLIFSPQGGEIVTASFDQGLGSWGQESESGRWTSFHPTHWMELPDPPATNWKPIDHVYYDIKIKFVDRHEHLAEGTLIPRHTYYMAIITKGPLDQPHPIVENLYQKRYESATIKEWPEGRPDLEPTLLTHPTKALQDLLEKVQEAIDLD